MFKLKSFHRDIINLSSALFADTVDDFVMLTHFVLNFNTLRATNEFNIQIVLQRKKKQLTSMQLINRLFLTLLMIAQRQRHLQKMFWGRWGNLFRRKCSNNLKVLSWSFPIFQAENICNFIRIENLSDKNYLQQKLSDFISLLSSSFS